MEYNYWKYAFSVASFHLHLFSPNKVEGIPVFSITQGRKATTPLISHGLVTGLWLPGNYGFIVL